MERELIEGNPVLVVTDIQGGESTGDDEVGIPLMPGYDAAMRNARARRSPAEILAAFEARR